MSATITTPCVTITPTICDGIVVRWYGSENAMRRGSEIVSASRNGVCGHGGYITPEMFVQAWAAHLALKSGRDVSHLATHRSLGIFSDEYVPVSQ